MRESNPPHRYSITDEKPFPAKGASDGGSRHKIALRQWDLPGPQDPSEV
ncbi:MAG: hypothetical protein GXY41_05945 [Phycisphaerae bacterium]|nr:hypothetical protein [Phycisphaerae bacterium]